MEPRLDYDKVRREALRRARQAGELTRRGGEERPPQETPERAWVVETFEDHFEALEIYFDAKVHDLEGDRELAESRKLTAEEEIKRAESARQGDEATTDGTPGSDDLASDRLVKDIGQADTKRRKKTAGAEAKENREEEIRLKREVLKVQEEHKNRTDYWRERCETVLTDFDAEYRRVVGLAPKSPLRRLLPPWR